MRTAEHCISCKDVLTAAPSRVPLQQRGASKDTASYIEWQDLYIYIMHKQRLLELPQQDS